MRSHVEPPRHCVLQPGQVLEGSDRQTLWRVESGALRLDQVRADGSPALAGMALQGDLVGVENLTREATGHQVRALTPSRLVAVAHDGYGRNVELLRQALAQSARQCRDMVSLRTGSAAERMKYLLLMLADRPEAPEFALDEHDCALPSLRDMAAVVDSAPETVSRVLGSLRRLDVLHDRRPSSVRFSRADLDQLKPVPGMTSSAVHAKPAELPLAGQDTLVNP